MNKLLQIKPRSQLRNRTNKKTHGKTNAERKSGSH